MKKILFTVLVMCFLLTGFRPHDKRVHHFGSDITPTATPASPKRQVDTDHVTLRTRQVKIKKIKVLDAKGVEHDGWTEIPPAGLMNVLNGEGEGYQTVYMDDTVTATTVTYLKIIVSPGKVSALRKFLKDNNVDNGDNTLPAYRGVPK
jgi:hypothetical protein